MSKKFVILLFLSWFIQAQNIDSLIEKLHKAPINKRYIIMNQIKKELAKLNSTTRMKALQKLQKVFVKQNAPQNSHKIKQPYLNYSKTFQPGIHTNQMPNKVKFQVPQMPHSPNTLPSNHMPSPIKSPHTPKNPMPHLPKHPTPHLPKKPMPHTKTPHMPHFPNRIHHEVTPMHQPGHIHKFRKGL